MNTTSDLDNIFTNNVENDSSNGNNVQHADSIPKNNKSSGLNLSRIRVRLDEPWVKVFLRVLIFLVVIAFIAIIFVIISKLYNTYPRIFWIGHSENLERYMRDHVKLMIIFFHDVRSHARGELRNHIEQLFQLNCIPSRDSDASPKEAPFLYLPYMFKRVMTSGDIKYWQKSELTLYERLMGMDTLMLNNNEVSVYQDSNNGQLKENIIQEIKRRVEAFAKLDEYFGKLFCKYKGNLKYDSKRRKCKKSYNWCTQKCEFPDALHNPKAEIARLNLILLVHEYGPLLEKMYDLRKSGGVGNFVIYNIYMSQYITFIFHEQIPDVWKNFWDDVKNSAELFIRVVGSEQVSSFMASLPLRLIGKSENFVSHPAQKEHFFLDGFGNMFEGLLELIPNLLQILLAIVSVITNPLQVVQYILALIIGLVLYILYMVVVAISPIFYIPAFVWILALNILLTVFWLALFIAIALFYFILWIINQATNGVVFDLLRCENLPNTWYNGHAYAFGNKHNRGIFCNYPCMKGWKPSGWFCKKVPKYQPPLCPQQIIMQQYIKHVLNKDKHNNDSVFYEFKPDINYVSSSDEKKKRIIETFIENESNFSRKCAKTFTMYNFIMKYACEHAQELNLHDDPILAKSCKFSYCKRFYNKECKEQKFIKLLKTNKKSPSNKFIPLDENDIDTLKDYANSLDPKPTNMYLLEPKKDEIVYITQEGDEGEIFPKGPYLPTFCDDEHIQSPEMPPHLWNRSLRFPNEERTPYFLVYSVLLLITVITGIALLTKKIKGM